MGMNLSIHDCTCSFDMFLEQTGKLKLNMCACSSDKANNNL